MCIKMWSKVWREIRKITVELATDQTNLKILQKLNNMGGNDKDLQNIKRLKPWIHFQIFQQEQEQEDGGSLKVSFYFNGEPGSPGFLFVIMIRWLVWLLPMAFTSSMEPETMLIMPVTGRTKFTVLIMIILRQFWIQL